MFVKVAAMPEENALLMLCGSSLSGSTDTKRAVFSPSVLRGALFPPSQKVTYSPRHACKLNSDIRVPLPTRQLPMMCSWSRRLTRDSDDCGQSGSRRNEATERGFPRGRSLASNPCQDVKHEPFSMGGNNNGLEKQYVPRGAPSHCCGMFFSFLFLFFFGSGERFWHLHRAHLPCAQPPFLSSTQTAVMHTRP